MQYNHNFLLCLGALIKQGNFFKLYLSGLPPPTLYNVKTLKMSNSTLLLLLMLKNKQVTSERTVKRGFI